MQNRLIAVDGLDASGKRTQAELLSATLAEKGIDYRYISFPTYKGDGCAAVNMYLRGDFGADPNAVNAYAASSFFAVDRYTSYMLDWKKDMESGKVIIADRYSSANAVHQLSKMRPEERDGFLDWLCDFEFGKLGLPRPAAVIYLCMPPEMSECLLAARCRETGSTPDIHEKNAAHLEASYRAAVYSAEKLGWIRVDCARGDVLRTREDIHDEIVERIKERLPDIGL